MKVIDLFAGIGGLSLGFEKAGFTIEKAFDNWDYSINIYNNNFKHKCIKLDLAAVDDYSVFGNPDIIIGGPPCQDYSSAGKRDENGGRATLTVEFAKIVANVLPKYFVMENVALIEKSKTLPLALEIFKKAGYGLTKIVLNASLCGVPQDRKRFFMIGVLGGKDNELLELLNSNQSEKPMTVRNYFGDTLGTEFYYRHPRSYARRAIFSIDEPSPTIRGVNRPIPKSYKVHPNDACKDLTKVRALTTIERSQIQTFPRSFVLTGTKADIEQAIGNAVPVNLASYVASCLLKYIKEHDGKETKN